MDSISNSLATQIMATLSSSLSAHVIAAISPQVASILTVSETLKTNIDEIMKLKTTITEQPGTPKSYSVAVQQNAQTAAPISAALVRTATRDCQILFDPTPGQALFAPKVTSAAIAGK
jgi:microcompartment protein CcmL/EutN